MQTADEILATLDAACESYTFPMLDNGYVYLAATRLALFRSSTDWAMVIEVFGLSPRAGVPDLAVATFRSTLHGRDPASNHASEDAYRTYLRQHPHDERRDFYPIKDGPWIDGEMVANERDLDLQLRDGVFRVPSRGDYERLEIELHDPDRVHVFELCRYVAASRREQVLATPDEQRVSVVPDMQKVLQLEDWHHPDLVNDERPSEVESFQQLAAVLSTGNVGLYCPKASPNTHWRNWPDGGTL